MASLGSYKLSPAQHWDSDSNPYGFNDWIKEMSSLVRTLKKGDILENFLDEKLKRVAKHSSLMSKVLLDDADFHNDAITAIIDEAEKSSTSILVTTQTLGATPRSVMKAKASLARAHAPTARVSTTSKVHAERRRRISRKVKPKRRRRKSHLVVRRHSPGNRSKRTSTSSRQKRPLFLPTW